METIIDGIIPVHKPSGMTSHDVVAKLRRILGTKKVGHTGTLDPDVSGVLPICINKATRISDYIMLMPKIYQAQMKLGFSTTTQDASGEIVDEREVGKVNKEEVEKIFQQFVGDIKQIPPMFSAVKVKGKKLHELAREGKEIERKPRQVTIYHIEITDMDLKAKYPTVNFNVKCSKGTYVRTLCVDIGAELGYPSHMSNLTRVKSGPFTLEQSIPLDKIVEYAEADKIEEIVVSMSNSLPDYKEVILSDEDIEKKVFNGQTIQVKHFLEHSGIMKIVNEKNQLVALYEKQKNQYTAKPVKVFK